MKRTKRPTDPATKPQSAVSLPDQQSVLVLVHLQNDFCSGGVLPVSEGDQVIPVANASRDWQPSNHCSFPEQGDPCPLHCVQGSFGARVHQDLNMSPGTFIVSGAVQPTREARSGFDGTRLDERLEELGARTLYVIGLATDTGVKHTVLEACRRGFRVVDVSDSVRGMNVEPGDAGRALAAMRKAGAVVAHSAALGIHV